MTPNIGITIGDFNGIGPELVIKTVSNELIFNYCTPVVYTHSYVLEYYTELLDYPTLDINIVRQPKDITPGKVNVRVCNSDVIDITPGTPSKQAGKVAWDALQLAVEDIKNGFIENILTAPIDKQTTVSAGLTHNGHTGYFAASFESKAQMILLNDRLRVAMVTGHTALKEVASQINTENIASAIENFHETLRSDFGIKKPKIAVLGINPHSGDNGLMGDEEKHFIAPAIEVSKAKGMLIVGPYAPDGFFGSKNAEQFDGVLGMYHDQVLIPFKQIAFSSGVNYTAGLPIIRTSPDHGTAYDIAGKGIGDSSSFINALYLINKINRNRIAYYNKSTNQLAFRDHRREKFSIGVPNLR